MWFAFRIDDTTFGAFAAFAADDDRDALLASGGPRLSGQRAELFAAQPTFEKVDIVSTRVA